jgi:uncharacterized protein (TIGR02466 family)
MIIDIFKTSIFQTKINNISYKKYFLNILKNLKKNNSKSMGISNIGGFQSYSSNEINNKEVLDNIILNPTKDFIKNLNPTKEIKFKLQSYWINSNKENDYNLLHNHYGSNISGVYYIKVPKLSGRLVFQNGDSSKLKDNNFEYFNNPNFYCRFFCNVEEGDLYLFSADTIHYVEPNRSKEERISVAFNIDFIK